MINCQKLNLKLCICYKIDHTNFYSRKRTVSSHIRTDSSISWFTIHRVPKRQLIERKVHSSLLTDLWTTLYIAEKSGDRFSMYILACNLVSDGFQVFLMILHEQRTLRGPSMPVMFVTGGRKPA
jgi:hypothetical protein